MRTLVRARLVLQIEEVERYLEGLLEDFAHAAVELGDRNAHGVPFPALG